MYKYINNNNIIYNNILLEIKQCVKHKLEFEIINIYKIL